MPPMRVARPALNHWRQATPIVLSNARNSKPREKVMMRVMLALAATLMAASCSNEASPIAGQTPALPNNADIVPGAGPLPEPPPAPPDKPPPTIY